MPEIKLTPATPGRLNKPAWFRNHLAAYGPVRKADGEHGPVHIHDAYLDGELIGAVIGKLSEPGGSLRRWEPETGADGVKQHGTTRFEALDAIVRGHLPAPRLARAA
jgi:hypothetical protein